MNREVRGFSLGIFANGESGFPGWERPTKEEYLDCRKATSSKKSQLATPPQTIKLLCDSKGVVFLKFVTPSWMPVVGERGASPFCWRVGVAFPMPIEKKIVGKGRLKTSVSSSARSRQCTA